MNKPGKLKKMALLASSYSPDVYDGAIGECRGILNYWGVEDTGVVTAKIDEQKADATRAKIFQLVENCSLCAVQSNMIYFKQLQVMDILILSF